jgi:DNA-binding NarL/FixJ family response regulator
MLASRSLGKPSPRAAEAAERLQPNLIILDPVIPNGLDLGLIDGIRQVCPDSHLVILSSAFELHGYRAAVRGDIHGYFLKDFAAHGNWLLAALMLIALASAIIVAPSVTGDPNRLPLKAVSGQVSGSDLDRLTEREPQVLTLVLQGLSDQQVAIQLSIALTTVETHVRNVSLKLGAQTRIHLGVLASLAGLQDVPLRI